ncbi:MAG: hypothetical protein E6K70_00960 [Planctomycetota bacterium]|nr:MAG: hypothetical protein E6K70_00960 [Planctomycetota bacterium]
MDSTANGNATPSPERPRRSSRGWVWFFIILAVLTVTAITVEVWFNAQQQLTPETLAEARKKWEERGPRDYDMDYTFKKMDSTDVYSVQVRGGKVTAVACNGQPEDEIRYKYAGMQALFGFIADFLEQDRQPGHPRTFALANFDANDGHLTHYVRSVMTTKERQEITTLQFRPRAER